MGTGSIAKPAHDQTENWKRTLGVMFTAQWLSIVGFSFVLPFLPFYIRELGVADEGLVPIWAGIQTSSANFVMTLFAPFWGTMADRYGRKIMVERAMFGGAFVTIAMGLVTDVYQLLILRLISGAVTGTISASISLVSSVVPKVRLGVSLGAMQAAVFLGMTLGPWIGGLLADRLGYRLTFVIGGVFLLVGGMMVWRGTQERFTPPPPAPLEPRRTMKDLITHPGFPALMGLFFLFNFSVHLVMPILPLFIEALDRTRTEIATTTGGLFAVTGAAAALSAAVIGSLGDRFGTKRVLILHMALAGILWFLHGLATSLLGLLALRLTYGLAAGGILPTLNALVGRIIPPDDYGKAYGITSSMTCLGMAVGPLIGGLLASGFGYRWPFFIVGAVLLLITFPLAARVRFRP